MVTKVSFKDKKQNRTTWINGKPVRFKNGIATVEDDKDAKELVKLDGYDIVEDDSKEDKNKKESEDDSKEDKNKKRSSGKK